ncbi:MAG: ROK family transcriptional regulator [Firmicutes bacterium]|nr:ROK family transcriptional regulator [Bacillota bacterium]
MNGRNEFPYSGKNLEDVQLQNRATVLQILHSKGRISRRELASLTGLTPSTITYITKDLLEKDLIVETGALVGRKGRRAIALEINPNSRFVIGVRLARGYITCGLFNLNARLLQSERVEISSLRQAGEVLTAVKDTIRKTLQNSGVADKVKAIGIAAPGPLSIREGKVAFISNFPGWRDIPLKEIIQSEFHIETIVEHDAHAAALAEKWFGAAQEVENLIYVANGRGVGAGIILNGQVYHGSSGMAGEIGHTSIDFNGPRCECGNYGCLEIYCSGSAVLRKAKKMIEEGMEETILSKVDPLTLQAILEAAKHEDKLAVALVKEAATYMAYGVVNLINTFHPDMVILGDEMAEAGEIWVDTVKEVALTRLLPEVANRVEIIGSSLKGDSFLTGTGTVAIEYLLRNP